MVGRWIWLFPLTYLAHIAEEYLGGFGEWASQVTGVRLANNEILMWNGIGWAAMTAGVALAARSPKWRWVVTTLGGIVLINALLHVGASIATRSYSPGVITGLLLWLPLGLYGLRHEWRRAARSTFWKGLAGMLVFHVVVGLGVFVFWRST